MGAPTATNPAPFSAGPTEGVRRFWLHRAGWGLLLGVAISTLEFAHYFPLATEPNALDGSAFAVLLLTWCGTGVLLLLSVGLAEQRLRPREPRAWQLALAVAIGSVGGVLLWYGFLHFVVRNLFGIPLFRDHFGVPPVWTTAVLYQCWMMLFFGGLAVAVHAAERRRARMLSALRAAEIDRATSQQRLAETRLAALRARVDPDFLLQTLARFERLHEAEPTVADHVLAELITFLRTALADPRTLTAAAPPPERSE